MQQRKKQGTQVSKQNIKQYPLGFINLLQWLIPVIAFLQISGEIFDVFSIRMLKPIPIILMIIYLGQSIINRKTQNANQLMSIVTLLGIMLSLVGDILLMWNSYQMFVVGTCFFLVAHSLYVVSFRFGKIIRQMSSTRQSYVNIISIILFIFYFVNMAVMWDVLPNRILFPFYGAAICFMSIYSLRRYKRTTMLSYMFTLIGAISFALSDNLLAFLKFNSFRTDLGRGAVMFLYYAGQYCIMNGSIFHDNKHYILQLFTFKWSQEEKQSLSQKYQSKNKQN